MSPTSSLSEGLADCDKLIINCAQFRETLPALHPILTALPSLCFCYFYPSQALIILGIRTREDLAVVRSLHKGVWAKKPYEDEDVGGACFHYRATVDGVEIDCRVSELPPSCRVVEERIEVPAHTKVIQRVVCNEPSREHAEHGQVISEKEEVAV